MLILLFIIIFLGGNGGLAQVGNFYIKQAREYIGDEVKDPARKKEAKAAAKAAEKGLLTFAKQNRKDGKELRKLIKDYASTPAQFDAQIEATLSRQHETITAIFASRQTMLKSITQEEWTAIVADARREDAEKAQKAAEKAAKKAAKP